MVNTDPDEDPVDMRVAFLIELFNSWDQRTGGGSGGESAKYYSAVGLQNTTYDSAKPTNARQWTYQYCTQFGWLQGPGQQPMRFSDLTVDYFRDWC